MRRCPQCQSPNPSKALACEHCGAALPALAKRPWLTWHEAWDPAAARWALQALPLILGLRWALGSLLMRGADPRVWRPVLFHLAHALLVGALLAWRRRQSGPWAWAWVVAGLAGGALSAALELSFLGGHVISTWAFLIWDYLGQSPSPFWTYQVLQFLRLAGLVACLWALQAGLERRPWKALLDLGFLGLALFLRSRVLGSKLWLGGLWQADPVVWAQWGLYALSAWVLCYALAPRGLTKGPARA